MALLKIFSGFKYCYVLQSDVLHDMIKTLTYLYLNHD